MKRNFWLAAICAVLFFIAGMGWGIWHHHRHTQEMAISLPLRILCHDKWLDPATLNRFSSTHNIRIEFFTYEKPSDFLKQMANTNGKIDVLCVSSFLVKSLIRSHWLKSVDYASLPNMKQIAVDFSVLPYDPQGNYTAPLFWNLYGFVGKGETPKQTSWRSTWQSKKLAIWADELNVLNLMNTLKLEELRQKEVKTMVPMDSESEEETIEDQHSEALVATFKKFSKGTIDYFTFPKTVETLSSKVDWVQLPLAIVAKLLEKESPYHFWLPEEGSAVEVGVLAIGEKSVQPERSLELINELISTNDALYTHSKLGMGVVHSSLSGLNTVSRLQKPEALREFPLNKLIFPDVDLQDLPRFQKIYNESVKVD